MNFWTGFFVGVVSLVPGISGGTVLLLMKKYDTIVEAITHIKDKKNRHILFFLVLGICFGTITFARIIEFLFYFFPNGTFILFSGLVLFGIPGFVHDENIKPKISWLFLGLLFIYILASFSTNSETVIFDYPKITISFLLFFAFCGMIDGFFTILPGVSGSMVMMILGPYFLYKSFLAQLSFETIYFLLPLLFYFLGDAFGFFLGSKVSIYFLDRHRQPFMNFVLGMVIMSVLVIFPILDFTFSSFITYFILFTISFLFSKFLRRFK